MKINVYNRESQSIILLDIQKHTKRKLQSFDGEKTKSQRQNEPKNPSWTENEERENRKRKEKEMRRRKKKKQWLHY